MPNCLTVVARMCPKAYSVMKNIYHTYADMMQEIKEFW